MRRHLVEQSKIERVDLKTDRILLLRRQRDPEFRPSPSGVESYAHGSEEYSKPSPSRIDQDFRSRDIREKFIFVGIMPLHNGKCHSCH